MLEKMRLINSYYVNQIIRYYMKLLIKNAFSVVSETPGGSDGESISKSETRRKGIP